MLRVAIVGRPNVGKSTLFNRLAGKKLALVHDTPGVTRDWREAAAKLFDLSFIALDTAGVEFGKSGSLQARMSDVTRHALDNADVALLVVDAREGLRPADKEVASVLRKKSLPVILLANKCDHKLPPAYEELHALGFGEPIPVSAEHGLGMRDVFEALIKAGSRVRGFEGSEENNHASAHPRTHAPSEEKSINLAIIGRPNVGKSTLVNCLLGAERMLTGPEAGLTRDAVHIAWEYGGKKIRLVDTAGVRRAQKVSGKLEKMAVDESKRAIRLAHVVVLVVDANDMFEKQDLDLARLVLEEGRALVLAVNKWDTIKNKDEVTAALRKFLDKNLAQAPKVPFICLSALKGMESGIGKNRPDSPPLEGGARGGVEPAALNLSKFVSDGNRKTPPLNPLPQGEGKFASKSADALMGEIFRIYELWNTRIGTGQLNRWLEPLLEHHPPPIVDGRRVKIRYMTQIKARPPTFLLWVSKPVKLPDSYLRYLANNLRERFELPGVPLRLEMRKGENPYD